MCGPEEDGEQERGHAEVGALLERHALVYVAQLGERPQLDDDAAEEEDDERERGAQPEEIVDGAHVRPALHLQHEGEQRPDGGGYG